MGVVVLTVLSRVVILHNPVAEGDDPATADVLDQVAAVVCGLETLGIPHQALAVPDWMPWRHLVPAAGMAVFNLMEAPAGRPELPSRAAAALELMGLPFTGSPASVLWLTTDKLATRALLESAGLPVAPGGRLEPEDPAALDCIPAPWILKPSCEDASIGLEGDPVCATREAALARARHLAHRFPGQAIVAEHFLPGRELNVSLLARDGDVEVLPIAEIVFEGFPDGMSRVVGYEAKWQVGSFAYLHTVRHFPGDPADAPLLERAREIARAVWRICGLRGYARIDLRLDENGNPHVLEVNANPCITAGMGLTAAAEQAGMQPGEVVRRILEAAMQGHPGMAPTLASRGKATALPDLRIRRGLAPGDRAPVEDLIRATGFFNPEEVEVALELVDDRLANGETSHYRFLVAESAGQAAGYACWGPIPGTTASADLYWIVVHPDLQGRKIGAALLRAAEDWMAAADRRRIYVETSTRPQYLPTRAFYAACGYSLVSELADFYAPGDGKAVFLKVLGEP